MKYNKPSLTYQQQISKFKSKGLSYNSEEDFIGILSRISYARFKEYSKPFIPKGHNNFKKNVKLKNIRDLYIFDHSLRMCIFEAIKVIEVALRTQIIQAHSISFGPYGYLDIKNFRTSPKEHAKLITRIRDEVKNKKKEKLITQFFSVYTSETDVPIWIVAEVVSFGTLSFFFKYLKEHEKQQVCDFFKVPPMYLGSWIHAINYTRNICAHHSRIWNITMAIEPKKYVFNIDIKNDVIFKEYFPGSLIENKVFYMITILAYMLDKINSPILNRYRKNIKKLFFKFPVKGLIDIRIASGMHNNAFDYKPWKNSLFHKLCKFKNI